MEQLELEQAIAMSLALEEERLRMAKCDAKKTGETGHSDPAVVAAASASLSEVALVCRILKKCMFSAV